MQTDPTNEALAESLREAVGAFVRHARTATDVTGSGQTTVLGYLARQGPHSIAELAAFEHVRHQSMARTVKNLQIAELVTLTSDPQDGRRVVVQITDAGRHQVTRDRQRRSQWIAHAIDTHLTPKERAELQRLPELLRKLTQENPR